MKQILQNLRTGETELVEVPCPPVKANHMLIQTHYSLVSAGTERMLLEFGKASLLKKAQQQPDKVKMVIDKIKTDGLPATITAVKNKLDQAIPMGYCNAGKVIAVGDGVSDFKPGDWVVSNGAHAEIITVGKNLCAKLPAEVDPSLAPFAILGAIGLQGIRLANPNLGEFCAVIGLGIIGLLTAQLLRAQGCRVIGFDYNAERLAIAEQLHITTINLNTHTHPVDAGLAFSHGFGLDAVFITTATKSQDPLHQAAQMSRKRGKVILIGVAGLDISRADFYEKELTFQVSCSYGPGRYDPNYEEAGYDYPYPFVRWTERRNIEAVLAMMAEKRLDPAPLISHRVKFTEAEQAYQLLSEDSSALGILLEYPQSKTEVANRRTIQLTPLFNPLFSKKELIPPKIGFIGAGNFGNQILIPAFRKTSAQLMTVATVNGINSLLAARKHRISAATTDTDLVLADNSIHAVVICTRPHNHAQLVCQALKAGKHVYVEKPLCLSLTELAEITQIVTENPQLILMVGFNRRFSPLISKMKTLLNQTAAPKCLVMTINAGHIPANHWIHNQKIGGGRILSECCHFIDLLRFLCGQAIVDYSISSLPATNDCHTHDTVTIQLKFADHSIGAIHYFANGHRGFPKERVEVFCQGKILQLDNFRSLTGYGWAKFRKLKLWQQDKGHHACAANFIHCITHGKSSPIPFHELYESATVNIALAQQCTD
jgi:predicted dehydrogenase